MAWLRRLRDWLRSGGGSSTAPNAGFHRCSISKSGRRGFCDSVFLLQVLFQQQLPMTINTMNTMGKRDDNGLLFSNSNLTSPRGLCPGHGRSATPDPSLGGTFLPFAARVIPTPSSGFKRFVACRESLIATFRLAWESPGPSGCFTTMPPSRSPQPSRLPPGFVQPLNGPINGMDVSWELPSRPHVGRPRPPYRLPFPRSVETSPRVCSIIEWFQQWRGCLVGASFPVSSWLGSPPRKQRPHLTRPPAPSPASASTQLPSFMFYPRLLP